MANAAANPSKQEARPKATLELPGLVIRGNLPDLREAVGPTYFDNYGEMGRISFEYKGQVRHTHQKVA